MPAPPPPSSDAVPWGKLARGGDGAVLAERSLAAHCRDVAAVFATLLRLPGLRSRLAALAGRDAMDETTVARLTALTHLHDCGKANAGFQARRAAGAPMVGHILPLTALFGTKADPRVADPAHALLRLDRFEGWGSQEAVCELFGAALSHHGGPWPIGEKGVDQARHWRATAGYDPLRALGALFDDAEAMAPRAFADGGPPLPDAPGFVHAVAGLIQLADWIASSDWRAAPDGPERDAWAAGWLARIGIDPAPWRAALAARPPDFAAAFGFQPHETQRRTATAEGALVILESETGSGKTEAALWRFVTLFLAGAVDGLFFALPTRTAAAQLHGRVEDMAGRLWPGAPPPVVLAVPGYLEDDAAGALPPAGDPQDAAADGAEADARAPSTWASAHPKRYFAALMSVGTIDQALLAVLRARHAHLRGALLMRHLLVVDEVHASDAYTRRLLGELLHQHIAAGGHALLLSATLGADARAELLHRAGGGPGAAPTVPRKAAEAIPYPLVSTAGGQPPDAPPDGRKEPGKPVAMAAAELMDDPAAVARLALEAARAGAKVLVVRNTVAGAVAVHRALLAVAGPDAPELFRVNGHPTLHHGRFAREDRRRLDRAVEGALGRVRPDGGRVVVGTQTLEQSLDIDADLLLTDLAPVDVLLQRLGRLFRHTLERDGSTRRRPDCAATPRALVLTPAGGLAPFLSGEPRPGGLPRHGLGPRRAKDGVPRGVYPDVAVLEATRRLIHAEPVWTIPAMNRRLVESALNGEAIADLLATLPEGERAAWTAHRGGLEGTGAADRATAVSAALNRNLPFMNRDNAIDPDERLTTRLGDESRLLDLPEGTMGPLGEPVRRLPIPAWMAHGIDVPRLELRCEPGTLRLFADGREAFLYDAAGLMKVPT